MERITTITAVRERVRRARADGVRVGFVPTMGALHEGHLGLVRLAAQRAGLVVVSVFVNPTQFDRPDDLAAYPRDLAGDEAALQALGLAVPVVVFAPPVEEMYPRAPLTTVSVAGLGEHLCGASRPGHFDGVATVVTKLLSIVGPDLAVFGRKDRQQLQIVRRLVADLDLPVEIVAGPTAREADGVALSSRNRRLSVEGRSRARALSRALRAAVEVAEEARMQGRAVEPGEVRAAAAAVLADAAVDVDYLEVVDAVTMQPTTAPITPTTPAVLAVAGEVTGVRLIDNVELGDADDEARLLAATS